MEDSKPGQFNNQFKEHPPLSALVKMPDVIIKSYENLFVTHEIDGDSLPFTGFQSSNWERYSTNERKIIGDNLTYFKNGFLDGVNKSFIPFADTPENRIKEVLNIAIVIQFSGFPISFKNNFSWLYDLGKRNGEIYKAWTIIFENPSTFEDYFREKGNLKHRKTSYLSHRDEAIIYKYKADWGYIPNDFNPVEIEKEFGAKRKQAIYTIWNKKGKTYRPPTKKELAKIIPFLIDFPNSKKAAENDLDNIK
jgi:hypothetical protein